MVKVRKRAHEEKKSGESARRSSPKGIAKENTIGIRCVQSAKQRPISELCSKWKMTELATEERVDGYEESRWARRGRSQVMHWMQERVRQLPFRLGGQEPEMPLGARVLVLKGEARNDLGQMAVISGIAGSQVEISYRGPTGAIRTRRKQRSSLIRLEDAKRTSSACP
jgi:hypothetical protein